MRGAIPEQLQGGFVVHDHFKSYYRMKEVGHVFCNGHHLRELAAVIELDGEPWAEQMRDLLLEANVAVREARAKSLPPERVAAFEEWHWAAIRLGFASRRQLPEDAPKSKRGRPKRRPAHNLLIRLKKHKTETLRFLRLRHSLHQQSG